jgi:hypothetical protein
MVRRCAGNGAGIRLERDDICLGRPDGHAAVAHPDGDRAALELCLAECGINAGSSNIKRYVDPCACVFADLLIRSPCTF